ncbi:MAG: RnfABCDGE type electron transport complex subunit D [Spirochaetales bacterium]|nr:RnfABCDGE type electron transport complex subunit D [Spirochaetales bacterium]
MDKLKVSSSPQFHNGDSTFSVMWSVSLALLPSTIWGFIVFGLSSLWIVVVSILSALCGEYILNKIYKKNTLNDGSAFLTGLLIGMNMPPMMNGFAWLYVPIGASFFAIFIVKWAFGGLGNNWMNPALGGRVFVFFSWTKHMTLWKVPMTDAVTGATPLGAVKSGLLGYSGSASGPLDLLNEVSKDSVSYLDLFLGKIGGSIGEVSALLLLIGAIFLIIKKIIRWEIYVPYLVVFAVFIWIFDGNRFGSGYFSGDVLFHILSGGLILGVFFMATDMVTSPLTSKGMIIYGTGCGFLTFLFRIYGANPEGVSLAIIVMNIIVPLINRYTKPRLFGYVSDGGSNE